MIADDARLASETSAAATPESGILCPDGATLTVDAFSAAARNPNIRIEITPEIRARVIASRKLLDEFVASGRIIYGVTTSVGGFVNWLVPPAIRASRLGSTTRFASASSPRASCSKSSSLPAGSSTASRPASADS